LAADAVPLPAIHNTRSTIVLSLLLHKFGFKTKETTPLVMKKIRPLIILITSLQLFACPILLANAKNGKKPDQEAKWETSGRVEGDTHFGPTKCSDGWFPGMTVYGSLEMENVLVRGALNVSGRVKLRNVEVEKSILVSGSLRASDLYVREDVQIQGNTELREVTIDGSLDVKGNTSMREINVSKNLNAFGPLDAKDFVIQGPTKLNGNIDCKNGLFQGELDISGSFQAKDTFFEKPIQINSMFIKLIDVQTKDITLQDTGSSKPQVVKILGKSLIEGNITFNNTVQGNMVEIDKDSRITGIIVNGDLKLNKSNR